MNYADEIHKVDFITKQITFFWILRILSLTKLKMSLCFEIILFFWIFFSSSLSSRNEKRVNSFESTLMKLVWYLINWRAFYFIKILWQNSVETLFNFLFCYQVELLTVRSVKQSKSVQTLQDGMNGRIPEKMDRVSTK